MTVPDSAGPSGKETAQLKNKLMGNKRRRDDDADSHEVTMNGTTKGGKKDEESDEEESRVGAIRKKAKVDPFAKKVKKKKTGSNAGERGEMVNGKEESVGKTKGKEKERDGKSVVTLFEVPSFGAGQSGSGTAGDKMEVDEDDSNNRRASETVEIVVEANGTGEGKKRKKKRKKNRLAEVGGEEQNPEGVAPATTKSSHLVTNSVSPRKAEKSGLSFSIAFHLSKKLNHHMQHPHTNHRQNRPSQASLHHYQLHQHPCSPTLHQPLHLFRRAKHNLPPHCPAHQRRPRLRLY